MLKSSAKKLSCQFKIYLSGLYFSSPVLDMTRATCEKNDCVVQNCDARDSVDTRFGKYLRGHCRNETLFGSQGFQKIFNKKRKLQSSLFLVFCTNNMNIGGTPGIRCCHRLMTLTFIAPQTISHLLSTDAHSCIKS